MLKKMCLSILSMFLVGFYIFSQQAGTTDSQPDQEKGKIQGCQVLPLNNIWNTPIDTLPVDANSAQYINTIGANQNVHADFGSGLWDGGPIGIPYITVPGTQAKVNVTFDYDDESDPGPYPIPPDAPIEGGSESDGDRHVLVVDRDNCILYELYYAFPQPDGSWTAGSGAIFDLKSNALRPAGWTSADAAGLPILPGLVRYDEVAAGEINHALRFTAPQTQRKYIWPARHYASSLTGSQYPPMGQRFRLKASFNISGYSPHVQVILKALKKYGMILADNGSAWYISGAPDERWNNDLLHQLDNVKGSDFEAVDESGLMISPNSGEARQNVTTNTITVISPNGGESWTAGSTHNITWSSTGTVGNVKIEYTTNNGSTWSTVVSTTANDGSYSWTVPAVSSTQCKVRVSETDGDPSDSSNAVFTIVSSSTPKITVTAPNGGESWVVGSTHAVTWTSQGSVGAVKITYTANNGGSWSTVVSSTANDGSYSWKIPATPSTLCKVKVSESDGSPSDTSNAVFSIVSAPGQPQIQVNRNRLNAGVLIGGAFTGPQTFRISNSGTGTLNWSLSDNAGWLSTSPSSGTNAGIVTVSINPTGLAAGSYTGTISITDSQASNSPQVVTVNLTVIPSTQGQLPFGSFDTPTDGAAVRSSIPVTGWALDDIEVANVKIYRQDGTQMVYIGDAVFVEGARPDIEAAFPDYPYNYKAGWGYMLLTNFLPNNGNGIFTLYAIAADNSGYQATLGSKTITCDNANAVKPFGAIDAPAQGGIASGSQFVNGGWVLTPQPNAIPTNGSTIDVYIDGVQVGHPVYNIYREDIASLFPGFANSSGAGGRFNLNTTQYENGVHTIHWTAVDNAGNTDGIGSRYFLIQNSGKRQQAANTFDNPFPMPGEQVVKDSAGPVQIKKGYHSENVPEILYPDENGDIIIEMRELERIVIYLDDREILRDAGEYKIRPYTPDTRNLTRRKTLSSGYRAYLVNGGRLVSLPIGSTLDPVRGVFYWQPGPGFLGDYPLVFFTRSLQGKFIKQTITITILPKY